MPDKYEKWKEEAISTAMDLFYSYETIDRLKEAKTPLEADRILKTERVRKANEYTECMMNVARKR